MEGMRELLRGSLRRSLDAMTDVDRLATAWPVVCGRALSAHGQVTGFDQGILAIEVSGDGWMDQMMALRNQLTGELGRVAGVKVTGIHFNNVTTRQAVRKFEGKR
jgi:hypothetical protein